jgi:hypothetical protein
MSNEREQMYNEIIAEFGTTVTRPQFKAYEDRTGRNPFPFLAVAKFRIAGSKPAAYDISGYVPSVGRVRSSAPKTPKVVSAPAVVSAPVPVPAPVSDLVTSNSEASLSFAVSKTSTTSDIQTRIQDLVAQASLLARVPEKSKAFVPFGDFESVRRVISSRVFCPIFITGHSGNGKTFQIEQACALENREYIRVNITAETDEDDLIGGFRLKDGETVFELGPIVVAMLRGAVLLLDEVDLAGPKVMCLQPVLEGNPLTIKKLGITIRPNAGFTVFATANTKGRGSDDGKYIGTNLLNEAFLERFNFTIEQAYPSIAVEKKILAKTYQSFGGEITDEISTFFETLARWADAIRATFAEDGIEDLISTRRLCHIVKTYFIFGDREKALTLCLNRFDKSVQAKFLDFYAKLSPEVVEPVPVAPVTEQTADNVPF